MNRRNFLKIAGISSFITAAGFSGFGCSREKKQPNIILIMADDLGYGDLGCYGQKQIKTPNLDKLAVNGMKFTDYHSNGAVCSPTRAALLTGRYQQRSGLEGVIYANGETRQRGLNHHETTFAEVFKSAGYKTGIFGKWHLGYLKKFNPVTHGFDEFKGYVSGNVDFISHVDGAGFHDWWHNDVETEENGYSTDLITKHTVNFIQSNKDRPFLAYVAHEAPHYPYQNRSDLPVRAVGKRLDENKRTDIRQACKEMIEIMDEGIGEIIETVSELGLRENTLIIFCSDNGAVLKAGSNGVLRGAKGGLFEGGHRVPAIASWPGKIKQETVTSEIVLSMDLFPTIMAVADLKIQPEQNFDGIDFSRVLFDEIKLPERTVFWRYRKQKVARKGKWKLLVQKNGEKQLFDLEKDLAESKNLAEDYPETLKQLENELSDWETDVDEGVEYLTT